MSENTNNLVDTENTEHQDENKILKKLNELTGLFEQKIQTDEWKNQKYDEMHSLMLKYQDDILGKMIDPLLKSLIQLNDSIERDRKHYSKSDEQITKDEIVDILDGISEQINAILFDYDIEEYSAGMDVVDAKEQKMFKAIATDKEELNNHVAEILNKGYKKNNKIIRMERVNIYKYINKEEN